MRVIAVAMLGVALSGCAAADAPRGGDALRNHCLSRMVQSRMRGAVNWQIYDTCLKGAP